MRAIGVLDLLGGVVVRGVGGRRHEYRPVSSRLTASCLPLDVARAYGEHLGLTGLYLADLDAIAGKPPAWPVYDLLRGAGFSLWVDAGVRVQADALALVEASVETVVAGLETLTGPAELAALACLLGDRLVFSLDLKDGQPLGQGEAWGSGSARDLADRAIAAGVRRLLLLDLARVGGGDGTGTEELCADLVRAHPEVEISAGGGVRGPADLVRLRAAGVKAVLLASALHEGRLSRADLE
jgi:phosphoribosylformimino-5-aminoimidazole carboxamide ribotide isomerase